MGSRGFCIPAAAMLFVAFVLQFLTSISLPYLLGLDIARTSFESGSDVRLSGDAIEQVRLGVWSYCRYATDGGDTTCSPADPAYSFSLRARGILENQGNDFLRVTIGSSWTRGLVVHPIAAGVIFVALILSFWSASSTVIALICSLTSLLAATLTLVAFAIDIALYVYLRNKMNDIGGDSDTAPGFWLTFVSFVLLLGASCAVCLSRRKNRMSSAYPTTSTGSTPWYKRFKRGGNKA